MKDYNISEVIEVRCIIEVEAARYAALRAEKSDIELLRTSLNVMENADVMDENYFKNDLGFHLNLVKASKNGLLSSIVTAYTPLMFDVVVASSQVDYCIERRYHYHRNIFDQIVKREPEEAVRQMRIHLGATTGNWKEYIEEKGLN